MDARVADRYRSFAAWARGSSPLYAEWSEGISGDDELTELIGALSDRRGQPNLVFAAARWSGCPHTPFPQWREWLLENWGSVAGVTAVRATQTNEVGRCATLLPVLSRIDGPLALLETGTAAGLCLFPDHHGYEYDTPAGIHRLDPASGRPAVRLPCRFDDVAALPRRLPEVVWRAGIDLRPIDASDPDAVAWLEMLVWPGPAHDGRIDRLRAAAAVARANPPRIVAGDIVDRLADVAREAPRDATLVVFHSAVLLYLDADARRRFVDAVHALKEDLPQRVVWLSNESAGTLPDVDAAIPTGLDPTGSFIQTVDGVPVALAGQHGATYETAALG